MQTLRYSSNDNQRPGQNFDLEIEQMSRLNEEQEHELQLLRKSVSSCQQENQTLKDKVLRLNENIKNLKYKDLAESKLNVTTEVYNKEIKQLEDTLQRYAEDNKRLTFDSQHRNKITGTLKCFSQST